MCVLHQEKWNSEDGVLIERKLKDQLINPVRFTVNNGEIKNTKARKASVLKTINRVGKLNAYTKL